MITLRQFRETDRELVREWRNRDHVRRWMVNSHVIGVDEHNRWFDELAGDQSTRYWIIVDDGVDKGVCNIANIDALARSCSSGLYLSDTSYQGQGIGLAAEYLMLATAFDDLELRRVWCEILRHNKASILMHQHFGFDSGVPQSNSYHRSLTKQDLVCLSLSRDVWETQRHPIEERLVRKGHLP